MAVRGLPRDTYGLLAPSDVLQFSLLKDIVQRKSLEAAIRAGKLGYNALIIGSFFEPFLSRRGLPCRFL